MDKISIIVPIYNVEKYLEVCLNSIINQTYKNLEIILVNDGSTDSCLDICNKYKIKDERILLINKQNGGLSDARNMGIEVASGKYIMFIDSDDWIDLNMVEILYKVHVKYNACLVQCGFIREFEENEVILDNNIQNTIIKILDNKQVLKSICNTDGVKNIVVWNKLYRKDLFDNITFPKGRIYEDGFTTYKILDKSKRIIDINNQMYHYRQREGSIINSDFDIKKLDAIDSLKERIEYFKLKKYDELVSLSQKQLQEILKGLYIKTYESNISNKKGILKNIVKEVRKNYICFIMNRNISIKDKFISTVICINSNIYCNFHKIKRHINVK